MGRRVLTEEHKSKTKESMKRWWQDPANREKRAAAFAKPGISAKMAANARVLWDAPGAKERMSKAMTTATAKAKRKTPTARLIKSKAAQKLWQNPEYRATHTGPNNGCWLGGLSFEPYCPKWTKDLRNRIRAFFNYECLVCGKSTEENVKQLSCHHITYNKQACCDGKPVQFAALCITCHAKTNKDRDRWEAMLHRIIIEIYDGRSYYTKEEMQCLPS